MAEQEAARRRLIVWRRVALLTRSAERYARQQAASFDCGLELVATGSVEFGLGEASRLLEAATADLSERPARAAGDTALWLARLVAERSQTMLSQLKLSPAVHLVAVHVSPQDKQTLVLEC